MIPEHPRFLSVAQISELADWLAEGPVVIRDVGALAAAALRPSLDVDGERIYRGEHEQAAALMHAIVTTRPFAGALNPGIGLFVALAALDRNGVRTVQPDAEYGQRLVGLVENGLDDVDVIALHLRQITLGEPWRGPLPPTG
ncbi:death-on-curing protein [Kineococcus radiotolerans]|uniref:Death-on-curing protein n=2 Tax=Kineococcus radiotolerans TaxID=131568 RepID=A6W9C3_KINRD|nr:death-on-curing protein [Kineococcus radiotolerans]ABS03412.1 Death-on-curing protein [Kineococcus radiotolerans SRS30216 = ATCC BAA-149]MBB2899470.1 death-on-curing protein [Kineococcus radiotolerans]